MKIENIEIDIVPEIETFCNDAELLFKPKEIQLDLIRNFLNEHLGNALNPNEKISQEVQKRIWDQKNLKKLSQVFLDKYGVCLEWCVVAHVVLQRVGIESVFRTATIPNGPGHCYLDVKIDDWQIFDPFAERYLEDIDKPGKRFQSAYYKDSFIYK